MMDLININLLGLQTLYMQQDPVTQGLSNTIEPIFKQLANEVNACLIYCAVDLLEPEILDELAWQLNISWYDATASTEIKRQLVKNAIKVHRYKGTPYAIEQVIKDYFGDGYVQEWFEYEGDPFYFRVVTNNASVTGDQADRFARAVDAVKNLRSRLEQVIIALISETQIYSGFAIHTGDHITVEQVV